MKLKKFLPGFLIRGDKIKRLTEQISEARERLAEAMVEECEIRGHVREVLEVVFERVGGCQRKADVLRVQVDFLRRELSEKARDSKQNEKFWKQSEKKINREYDEAFERAESRKLERKDEIPEEKKPRLQKVWMKLVKLFHPDKHMDNAEEKDAHEEVMKIVNLAKKDGDLEKLEAIAEDPERFLDEVRNVHGRISKDEGSARRSKDGRRWFRNEEKELRETLDSLLERIRSVRKDIKDLKKSPDMCLWAMWKGRPGDFESAMREMKRELTNQIKALEKTIEKLQEKMDEKCKMGWAA